MESSDFYNYIQKLILVCYMQYRSKKLWKLIALFMFNPADLAM